MRLKLTIFLGVLALSMPIAGCSLSSFDLFSPFRKKPQAAIKVDARRWLSKADEDLERAGSIVHESATSIRDHTIAIKKGIAQITSVFPVEASVIQRHADGIGQSTKRLDEARGQINSANKNLSEATKKVAQIESEYSKAVRARNEALTRERDALKALMRWIVAGCVIGFGVGVVLMFFRHLVIGGGVAIGALATMVLAVTIEQYLQWIAIAGLVIIVAAIGWLGYQFFVRERTIKEIVETAEIAKSKLSDDDKHELFGEGVKPGLAHGVQGSATKDIVHRTRKQLKAESERSALRAKPNHGT